MSSEVTPPRGPARLLAPLPLALAALLFLAGLGLGQVLPLKDWLAPAADPDQVAPDAWRAAFAADFALTTTQTLEIMPHDDRMARLGLGAIGKRLSIDLSPSRLDLPKETLLRSGLFFFRNALVGQVVYADEENGAIALYILKRDDPPAPIAAERRNGLNIAYWSSGGHVFMLAGVAPDSVLADLAGKLKAQLGS